MKNRIIYAIAIVACNFICTNVNAQCPLSFDELISSSRLKVEKFKDYINDKGYVIHEDISNKETKICTCTKYMSDKAADKVNRSIDPSGNYDIMYQTPHKEQFDKIFASMTEKGYKYKEEMPFTAYNNPTKQKIYFKDKSYISVFEYVDKNRVPWYAFRAYWAP